MPSLPIFRRFSEKVRDRAAHKHIPQKNKTQNMYSFSKVIKLQQPGAEEEARFEFLWHPRGCIIMIGHTQRPRKLLITSQELTEPTW